MGMNSVPRDAAVSDFHGGRITKFGIDRPHDELLSHQKPHITSFFNSSSLRA